MLRRSATRPHRHPRSVVVVEAHERPLRQIQAPHLAFRHVPTAVEGENAVSLGGLGAPDPRSLNVLHSPRSLIRAHPLALLVRANGRRQPRWRTSTRRSADRGWPRLSLRRFSSVSMPPAVRGRRATPLAGTLRPAEARDLQPKHFVKEPCVPPTSIPHLVAACNFCVNCLSSTHTTATVTSKMRSCRSLRSQHTVSPSGATYTLHTRGTASQATRTASAGVRWSAEGSHGAGPGER